MGTDALGQFERGATAEGNRRLHQGTQETAQRSEDTAGGRDRGGENEGVQGLHPALCRPEKRGLERTVSCF